MKTKMCVRCHELWPPDTEFYESSESEQCLACDQVAPYWKKHRTPEAIERRREYQRLRWRRLKGLDEK